MKLKLILKSFLQFMLIVSTLMIFVGCKEDELSKLFKEGELGDFWDLKKDDAEIVAPPKSEDDYFIDEDEVLNMDIVKRLAYGDISPFNFMKKFPVQENESSGVYRVLLPNDYAVRIEYSDNAVNLIYLEDNLINKSLDLQTDSLYIDMFLSERE